MGIMYPRANMTIFMIFFVPPKFRSEIFAEYLNCNNCKKDTNQRVFFFMGFYVDSQLLSGLAINRALL